MKDILKIRWEIFVTPLFIVLFGYSIKYVGFETFWNIVFNLFVLLSIPACYLTFKTCRKMLYEVFYED